VALPSSPSRNKKEVSDMKKKVEKVLLYIQLILSGLLLFFLILSDFGIIFPSENHSARVLLHFSAMILLTSSLIQLYIKKEK